MKQTGMGGVVQGYSCAFSRREGERLVPARFVFFLLAFLFLSLTQWVPGPAEAAREGRRNRPVPVQVQEASVGRIGRGVVATGTIFPFSEVKIMSRAEGQVTEVRVREGDRLIRGQIIATLDSAVPRIQLALAESELEVARARLKKLQAGFLPQEIASAEAGVAQARASLKRSEAELSSTVARLKEAETNANALESMFKRGVVSRQEWIKVSTEVLRARADIAERRARLSEDRARIRAAEEQLKLKRLGNRVEDIQAAKAEVQKALQNVHLLRTQLDYYEIESPISGVVTERRIEPGDLAVNRAHLFTLAHIRKLRVRVNVSELDLTRLRKDQAAHIQLDAYRERDFRGKLTKIFPRVDPRTRQVIVEVELPNKNLLLRPGLLARVRFDPILGRKAINLPARAVVWDGDIQSKRGHVFVIERVKPRKSGEGEPVAQGGKGRKRAQSAEAPQAIGGSGNAEATEKGRLRGRRGGRKGPRFRAKRREVRLGRMVDGRIEILEGLEAGERVIVSATGQLKDGQPIRIVK